MPPSCLTTAFLSKWLKLVNLNLEPDQYFTFNFVYFFWAFCLFYRILISKRLSVLYSLLSFSQIKSLLPTKPIESGVLGSEAYTKESMINALYIPNSIKSTASTMQSSQGSLVGTLEKLDLNTASPSSGRLTDSQCICGAYAITRHGDRVKLDCVGRRCGELVILKSSTKPSSVIALYAARKTFSKGPTNIHLYGYIQVSERLPRNNK
jgi:hypothetical protein